MEKVTQKKRINYLLGIHFLFYSLYYLSIGMLLLNSIWYFIRLFVFNRRIDIGFLEGLYDIIILFNLIIALFAIYKIKKVKKPVNLINYLLKTIFICYSLFSVISILYRTYIDIPLSVQPYWNSGEWTF